MEWLSKEVMLWNLHVTVRNLLIQIALNVCQVHYGQQLLKKLCLEILFKKELIFKQQMNFIEYIQWHLFICLKLIIHAIKILLLHVFLSQLQSLKTFMKDLTNLILVNIQLQQLKWRQNLCQDNLLWKQQEIILLISMKMMR